MNVLSTERLFFRLWRADDFELARRLWGSEAVMRYLVEEKWGQGYALEAARAVVRHAFEDLKMPLLRTGHHPENVSSKKVLLKLGFTPAEPVFYKPTGLMHPTYSLPPKSGKW